MAQQLAPAPVPVGVLQGELQQVSESLPEEAPKSAPQQAQQLAVVVRKLFVAGFASEPEQALRQARSQVLRQAPQLQQEAAKVP